jgi:hypothetical protein
MGGRRVTLRPAIGRAVRCGITDAECTVWFDVRRALEACRDRHKAEESTLPYAAMGRPRRSRLMHRRIRRKD